MQRGPDSVLTLLVFVFVPIAAFSLLLSSEDGILSPRRVLFTGAPLLAVWVGNLHSRHSTRRRGRMIIGLAADLDGADLTGADLQGFSFRDRKLARAKLSNSNLTKALFAGCDLEDARFTQAIMKDADLRAAHAWFAGFYQADLRGAHLDGADLEQAVFLEANMRGVSGRQVNLQGADLRRSDLSGAVLIGADLRGAKLAGCDLTGANLRWSLFDEHALSVAKTDGVRLNRLQLGPAAFDAIDIRENDALRDYEARTGTQIKRRALGTTVGVLAAMAAIGLLALASLFSEASPEVLSEDLARAVSEDFAEAVSEDLPSAISEDVAEAVTEGLVVGSAEGAEDGEVPAVEVESAVVERAVSVNVEGPEGSRVRISTYVNGSRHSTFEATLPFTPTTVYGQGMFLFVVDAAEPSDELSCALNSGNLQDRQSSTGSVRCVLAV